MKGGLFRRQMANVIAVVGLLGGWFGSKPKKSDWQPEQQIGGYMGAGSSRLSQIKKRHRSFRHRVGYGIGHNRRYLRYRDLVKDASVVHYIEGRRIQTYKTVSGGRGTEWIKENRRRRAYGLPQLRQEVA